MSNPRLALARAVDDEPTDAVLLATTAGAVRELQAELETIRGQLAAMRQQIRDINHRESA